MRDDVGRRVKECVIEKHLINRVESLGGACIKFTPMGNNGYPDRIVILPEGRISFVELKRPGEHPRPLQYQRIDELRRLGVSAWWANSIQGVDDGLNNLLVHGTPIFISSLLPLIQGLSEIEGDRTAQLAEIQGNVVLKTKSPDINGPEAGNEKIFIF